MEGSKSLNVISALLILLVFSALTTIFSHDLKNSRAADLQRALDQEATHIAARIENKFEYQIQTLERLASRWEAFNGIPEPQWHHEALKIVGDFNNFQAVEWIDTEYLVRWIEPLQKNEKAVGFNIAFNDQRRRALDAARNQGSIDSTGVITLKQGGQGMVVYVPIGRGESFQGFMVAVFLVKDLLDSLLSEQELANFTIQVLEGTQQVFFAPSVDDSDTVSITGKAYWKPFKTNWTLVLTPSKHWAGLYADPAAPSLFYGGLISSFLLALAGYLALSNFQQKRTLIHTVLAMEKESAERHKAEKNLSHAVSHDVLTGLPNRSFFIEDLQQSIQQARRLNGYLAVLIVDLDDFKKINDTLGHSSGDTLIQQVSDRFIQSLAETESSLSRVGGDEFMLLLEDIHSVDEVIACAADLRRCCKSAFQLNDKDFFISCSIGISIFPEGGSTAEDLIQNADVALYKAKGLGRDNYQFFTTGMQAEALRRLELDGLLRNAISLNQLSLVFQPKVSLTDNTITGAEVLLRWNHPEKGQISPGEFIPLAEENGMIRALGKWVFDAACKQVSQWSDNGLAGLKLAINLSSTQLEDTRLVDSFKSILANHNVDPTNIELELTEEVFIDNQLQNQRTLSQLKKMGFSLSIDDFGVGYSSLAYLRNFPISAVKIDRTFVSQLETNRDDQVIVNAVIAMAHNLGLEVVAEGIETREQMNYLRHQNCDQGQGFLFSKPLPADEFLALYLQSNGVFS